MSDGGPRADRAPRWRDGDLLTVGGSQFVCSQGPIVSRPDQMVIRKERPLVDAYLEMLPDHVGDNIVELGVNEGGSTALLALVGRPGKLLAIDHSAPVEALGEFLTDRGLADSVDTAFDTDQADREALRGLVERTFADEPLDLVIDDASHLLGPTRASFEELFPRLRPGGRYLIEDWPWEHRFTEHTLQLLHGPATPARASIEAQVRSMAGPLAEGVDREELLALVPGLVATSSGDGGVDSADTRPLAAFAIELMVLRATSGGLVAEVEVDEFWISVRRGPAVIDPPTFHLDGYGVDPFGFLST